MSVEVAAFDGGDDRWDGLVEQSPQGTVFHRSAALAAQADHAGGELYRLVGYTGEEPVGLLPVVVLRRGPPSRRRRTCGCPTSARRSSTRRS